MATWNKEYTPLETEISVARKMEVGAIQSAVLTADNISDYIRQGMTEDQIIDSLERQFLSGRGPIADLRSSLTNRSADMISRSVSVDYAREKSGGNPEMMGTWLTTGRANVCSGCRLRHGEKMTERRFEELHGTHECGVRCYCWWEPGEIDNPGPIIMSKDVEKFDEGWAGELV